MNEGMVTCGHPSRGRYVQGCRCYMCRVANADYSREHSHRASRREGSMASEKATSQARSRVRSWLAAGIPLREICRQTGVPRSSMHTLLHGHRNTPAGRVTKTMTKVNHRRIMRCDGFLSPGGEVVDAASALTAVEWLVSHGMPRAGADGVSVRMT